MTGWKAGAGKVLTTDTVYVAHVACGRRVGNAGLFYLFLDLSDLQLRRPHSRAQNTCTCTLLLALRGMSSDYVSATLLQDCETLNLCRGN
jgi:hypothetical protein